MKKLLIAGAVITAVFLSHYRITSALVVGQDTIETADGNLWAADSGEICTNCFVLFDKNGTREIEDDIIISVVPDILRRN